MKYLEVLITTAGILLVSTCLDLFGQKVIINEFMARNETTLADADGDYTDWIELRNNSAEAIQLSGYGLSDDPLLPGKWSFPIISLPPGNHLLVFASGKDSQGGDELHSNFRIDGDGEELFLSDKLGRIIDRVGPVALEPDEVYGRLPDGSEHWTRELRPSPGSANIRLNLLSLSHPPGFYRHPFELFIYSTFEDTVRFSLNGEKPGPDADIYIEPILVENKHVYPGELAGVPSTPPQPLINYKAWESPEHPIEKIQVLSFASFKGGKRTSDIYTASYFVDEGIMERYSMPVISLVTDPGNLFREDSGIYLPGAHYDSSDPQWSGNYFQTGRDWEKPVHIEFFGRDGKREFAQGVGVRIHGMMTRQAAQKTLRLYARESYGKKDIAYPLLPRRINASYKRILLRSTMGSWQGSTVIPDEVAQEISRDLNIENQEYQPVVLYLNGEYWGIQTLRDRIDERYLSYLTGVDRDSVDLINGNYGIVDAGSNQNYIDLASYIQENNLTHDEHYMYVASQVDLESLIDYMITEIFFSNRDWPWNNQKCWRPQAGGGLWRWILFDLDAGFGKADKDLLKQFTDRADDLSWEKSNTGTYLLKNLLKNQEFKQAFTSRFIELLNHQFSSPVTTTKLQVVMEQYRDEMPHHIERWGYPRSIDVWESDIYSYMVSFLQKRPCELSVQLKEYFNVDIDYQCPEEPRESDNLLVLPNPSAGIFSIRNESDHAFSGRALMTSTDGRLLAVEEQIFIWPGEQFEMNYTHLGAGIYLLYLVNELQVERKRVVITH